MRARRVRERRRQRRQIASRPALHQRPSRPLALAACWFARRAQTWHPHWAIARWQTTLELALPNGPDRPARPHVGLGRLAKVWSTTLQCAEPARQQLRAALGFGAADLQWL